MTEGTDTPTDGQAAQAPAESETSKPAEAQAATPDNETEQTPDATAKPEGEEAQGDDGESEGEKPKRRSGYDRMKRRALMAEAALANERLRREAAPKDGAGEDKAPREEDFNGDWGKFIAASAAYEAAKAVKDTLRSDKEGDAKTRAAEIQAEIQADFKERAEAYKATAKDFDEVIGKFVDGGGKFTDTVRDLVLESDKGPELAYFLAKNPAVAKNLNSLSEREAAKQIGALEATLSRPQAKTTKAPPPIRPPSGGASPPVDLQSLAKSDNADAYIAMRRKQKEARA